MRWLVRIGFALLIVAGFSFFARVIVRVKTLQLRQQLSRQRLLNYELSSEILRSRFRKAYNARNNTGDARENGDFAGEVRLNVLESGVMNENTDLLRVSPDPSERMGMYAVNMVRILNFKSVLRLNQNAEALMLAQYAFLMERKKRFKEAREIYGRLEKRLSSSQADDHAFVLLHAGYCLAVLGETPAALDKLGSVRRWYPGTHFEESARVLALVIRENTRRKKIIAGKHRDNPAARARAYYRNGQYREAAAGFANIRRAGAADDFMYARSLEEIGKTGAAEKIYRNLVEGGSAYRKPAVRRLLLLGKFFGAGRKTAEYAANQARKLGDRTALREIQKIKLVKAPRIVQELKKNPPAVPGLRADIVRGLKREFPRERFARELAEPPKEKIAALTPGKTPPNREPEIKIPDNKEPDNKEPDNKKPDAKKPEIKKPGAKSPSIRPKARVRKKTPVKRVVKKKVPSAPIIKQSQLLIRLADGRVLYGNAIRLQGELLVLRLRAAEITIPFEAVSEISIRNAAFTENAPGMSAVFGGERLNSVMAIRRIKDGIMVIRNGTIKLYKKPPTRLRFSPK